MFVVDEASADAIRAALQDDGELAAAIELRRRFPGVTDNEEARRCVHAIASWQPTPPLRLHHRRARNAPRRTELPGGGDSTGT